MSQLLTAKELIVQEILHVDKFYSGSRGSRPILSPITMECMGRRLNVCQFFITTGL